MKSNQPIFRLLVKFHDHLNLPYGGAREIINYFSQNDFFPIKSLLNTFPGLQIGKLFTSSRSVQIAELTERACRLEPDYQAPDFLSYYTIDCPYKQYSEEILEFLLRHNQVEWAYVEAGPAISPSNVVADYPSYIHQGYLKPAPFGIDTAYAWNKKGGDGKSSVKFIDIEYGWNANSKSVSVGTFPLTGKNFSPFKDHGAAVLGVILMSQDSPTGRGIAPKANGYIISQWRPDGSINTSDAIMAAISKLTFGDIILLEAQITDSPSGESLWPVEIQKAVFDVIRFASALGIVVIEAGGNGNNRLGAANDLDNFRDENGKRTLNPSSPDFRDSNAILVAAGSDQWPHTPIRHSNVGSRMDCYTWGERVSTAGSHLASTDIAMNSYRQKISGTSAAAAIITGAAILVQSITETNEHFRLSPKQMRQLFRNDLLGTASANGRAADKIGVMPDLKKIIDYIQLNSSILNDS